MQGMADVGMVTGIDHCWVITFLLKPGLFSTHCRVFMK